MTRAAECQYLVITGLSGSGKSVALNALEDLGYYCVDNLPAALLPGLAEQIRSSTGEQPRVAVGIDARTGLETLKDLPRILHDLDEAAELVFLTADEDVLIRRFSETRRRHPLAAGQNLAGALREERRLLAELRQQADHVVDTTGSNIHQLRQRIWQLAASEDNGAVTVLLESFAYKHGLPQEADLIFDARCLPNPHWQPGLRSATGLEREVREFLSSDPVVAELRDHILAFLQHWLPAWSRDRRSHITAGIGCTGGRHRSVFLVDDLAGRLRDAGFKVITHHRELEA